MMSDMHLDKILGADIDKEFYLYMSDGTVPDLIG